MSSKVVTESRTHDFAFDPATSLTATDFRKNAWRAQTITIQRRPVFGSFFSEVGSHPNITMGYKARPGPSFQYQPYRPNETAVDIVGRDRYRYFEKPVAKTLGPTGGELLRNDDGGVPIAPVQIISSSKEIAIQTDYRESEAQTEPYSPEYRMIPGHNPEVLTAVVEDLRFSNDGLPAGLAQIQAIKDARAKRMFEQSLPPMNDWTSLQLRRQMMSAHEAIEFQIKTDYINNLEAQRLELLQQLLQTRTEERQRAIAERVQAAVAADNDAYQKALTRIQRERTKSVRKLMEMQKRTDPHKHSFSMDPRHRVRPDLIGNTARFGSRAFHYLPREGKIGDVSTVGVSVVPSPLTTLSGLALLEQSVYKKSDCKTLVTRPPVTKRVISRKERQLNADLERVDQTLKEKTGEIKKQVVQVARARTPRVPVRPPTPTLSVADEPDEDSEMAVVLLQRLLRGRATQNRLFEGKERRLELIKELRTSEVLAEMELLMDKEQDAMLQAKHKEQVLTANLSQLSGEMIGSTLDYLSKELVRARQQRSIAAMVQLAERERRMREAEEAGTRQLEEARRAREDEQFLQIMKIHHTTVDQYLEELVSESVQTSATNQAHRDARLMATKINNVVDNLEARYNSPEVIIRDLLQSFLLPEVQRIDVRRRVELEQRKFCTAAKAFNHTITDAVLTRGPNPPPPATPSH